MTEHAVAIAGAGPGGWVALAKVDVAVSSDVPITCSSAYGPAVSLVEVAGEVTVRRARY